MTIALTLLLWLPVLLAAAAVLGLIVLLLGLIRVITPAPRLPPLPQDLANLAPPLAALPESFTESFTESLSESLTVVVPAYNEAANIADCLTSILVSHPPCSHWQLLLVDDESSDATVTLAKAAAEACAAGSDRFRVLAAGPRPAHQRWVGKNWACTQAMEQVHSTWVLFVDADVRLQPATLRRALAQAQADRADLLTLAPRLRCGCLAEWMVQPIIASLLGLGFPIAAANDPASAVAFAAGPFMLFRRSSYLAIGGHRALAAEVVEDLALARAIKAAGYRLRYLLGLDAVDLRMYADFPALWEGWSKNWLLGLGGNVPLALAAGAVVLLLFSGPWLLAPATAIALVVIPQVPLPLVLALMLALLGIGLQWALRLWSRQQFQLPMRHWWLMGAGGLVLAAIAPTSVWRTLSGRGWTWKGRPLA